MIRINNYAGYGGGPRLVDCLGSTEGEKGVN